MGDLANLGLGRLGDLVRPGAGSWHESVSTAALPFRRGE